MKQEESNALAIDLDGISKREPEISAEEAEPYENAALIGAEKLESSGFFVNIVRRGVTPDPGDAPPLILIVEDDPGTSGVIEAIVKSQGFSTRLAANLGEIRRGLSEKPSPDLILLDILLPDANGFAVLERLRRHPDLGSVPVLFLTSLSEPADVAKGLALGATGYLSKPAQPRALVGAIRTVLGMGS